MPDAKQFMCIHGHFYQPPRENPWTGKIELQEGAHPYHDWNERIYHECYLANAMARVLDSKGFITDIVNNFEKVSFNFGPTLLSWLEQEHPETLRQILEADKKSAAEHNGHGNAIAQAYNHMIMPLANPRDKHTQVQWGIEEFRHRFGRDPESMWLPETACNEETLEVLVEFNMKYLILEPHQAEAIRLSDGNPDSQGAWHDVSGGQIDPKHPHRCFLKNQPGKFIDIFFYDGPISKDLGFGDLLFDSKLLMDRIDTAVSAHPREGLIHVATDGETYGHHKAFGERALAYALHVEGPKRGYSVVNYGEYLEKNPPKHEVRLKSGENNLGTSWSCAHGVKRWKEHCGCRGEGPENWTQHWRGPLREALDWLRDELAKIFEQHGSQYFNEVWEARNAYIQVILDRSDESVRSFIRDFGKHELGPEDQVRVLKLMEMQRHAMLMYTSCGWFFTELSGLETVQILTYAAKAIELAHETAGTSLEAEFEDRLKRAKSNMPDFGNGQGVYGKLVKPKMISWSDAVSYYAILSGFDSDMVDQVEPVYYGYSIKVVHQRRETSGELALNFARVILRSMTTGEEKEFAYITAKMGAYDIRCSVKPFNEISNCAEMEKELFEDPHSLHVVEVLRKIDSFFGEKYYSVRDLPLEDRKQITQTMTSEVTEKLSNEHEALFDQNRKMSENYQSVNLPIPHEMKFIAEVTLRKRLNEAVVSAAGFGFNLKKMTPVNRIMRDAKAFGVKLRTEKTARFLNEEIQKRVNAMESALTAEMLQECLNICKLAAKVEIVLDEREIQNRLFFLIKSWVRGERGMPDIVREKSSEFLQFLRQFHVSPDGLPELIEKEIQAG